MVTDIIMSGRFPMAPEAVPAVELVLPKKYRLRKQGILFFHSNIN